jgi:hypothetical protein
VRGLDHVSAGTKELTCCVGVWCLQVVARRETHYRVPWQRVAEWRDNPTVYR